MYGLDERGAPTLLRAAFEVDGQKSLQVHSVPLGSHGERLTFE